MRSDVEGDDYVYDIGSVSSDKNGDFRAWCEVQKQGGASCPPDGREPASSNRLAAITFVVIPFGGVDFTNVYRIDSGYCYPGRATQRDKKGTSSDLSQNIMLELSDYPYSGDRGELVLNNDEISYTSGKTYYLYIGTSRYTLSSSDKQTDYRESCGSTHRRNVVYWQGFLPQSKRLNSGPHNVYIASEENGVCEFYKP